jgi:hypothetical protein
MSAPIKKSIGLHFFQKVLLGAISLASSLCLSAQADPLSAGYPSDDFDNSSADNKIIALKSKDLLARYVEALANRHGIKTPDFRSYNREQLGQYFMQMMQKISNLPPEDMTNQDYQDIGMLTEEFEDIVRIMKGRLALTIFRNEQSSSKAAKQAEIDQNALISALEKTRMTGDFVYAPMSDNSRGVRDSMTTNLRGRVNITAKVFEGTEKSTLGDGYLFMRLTAASGRFFPRNKWLLSSFSAITDSVMSPFNSGNNETQVLGLVVNNNNSNSTRPTVSMEQAFYTQDMRMPFKLSANYKAGLMSLGNVFDTNTMANNDAIQFMNSSFNNNVSWRGNFVGPSLTFTTERKFFKEKMFARLSGGITSLTDRDYWGSVGSLAEFQIGHRFFNREGNYRMGFWQFNFRGGSALPFVAPIDTQGTSLISTLPGNSTLVGPTYGSQPAGLYLSCDQRIWKNLGIFGRYALNDKQLGEVLLGGLLSSRQSWSIGSEIPMNIFFKKRKQDVIGIAYGQVSPLNRGVYTPATPSYLIVNGNISTNLNQVNQNVATMLGGTTSRNEKVLEAYYRFHLNEKISISPDIQYYWNPGGTGPTPGIFILGSRLTVAF